MGLPLASRSHWNLNVLRQQQLIIENVSPYKPNAPTKHVLLVQWLAEISMILDYQTHVHCWLAFRMQVNRKAQTFIQEQVQPKYIKTNKYVTKILSEIINWNRNSFGDELINYGAINQGGTHKLKLKILVLLRMIIYSRLCWCFKKTNRKNLKPSSEHKNAVELKPKKQTKIFFSHTTGFSS